MPTIKALPCRTPGCTGGGRALLPGGRPYYIGQAPRTWPHHVKCHGCKRVTIMSQVQFNALPLVDPAEVGDAL